MGHTQTTTAQTATATTYLESVVGRSSFEAAYTFQRSSPIDPIVQL